MANTVNMTPKNNYFVFYSIVPSKWATPLFDQTIIFIPSMILFVFHWLKMIVWRNSPPFPEERFDNSIWLDYFFLNLYCRFLFSKYVTIFSVYLYLLSACLSSSRCIVKPGIINGEVPLLFGCVRVNLGVILE